ncbi:MAG: hypothetical protein GEU90_03680 [Gemmatimonas sp.]|nr:hypothetical protein [Gemmatimonas sp.]
MRLTWDGTPGRSSCHPRRGVVACLEGELRSALAKRIYQVLALRMARGVRPPFVFTLADCLDEIAFGNGRKPGMQAKQISSALCSLQKASIVLSHEVREIGHGAYEIVVVPGERLHAAGLFRGVGAQDKTWTRTLLYHLGIFGISLSTGRQLLRSFPTQTVNVLRRAYYLQTEKGGMDMNGRPVENWGGWIRGGIENGWEFTEPGYLRWLDRMSGRALDEESLVTPVIDIKAPVREPKETSPDQSPTAPPSSVDAELPAGEWGQALERFRPQVPALTFDSWLRNTWQIEVTNAQVRVGTPNTFAVGWIQDKYGEALSAILSELLERPISLSVHHEAEPQSD